MEIDFTANFQKALMLEISFKKGLVNLCGDRVFLRSCSLGKLDFFFSNFDKT